MNILVIIPARGGSKGIPGKNIKLLGGKPLIGYTIDAARSFSYGFVVVLQKARKLRDRTLCNPLTIDASSDAT